MEKEFHITHVMKELRVMKGILKETMTKASWREAFNKYSLKDAESPPKTNKSLTNTDD